jgi:hypothetical protein
MRKFKDARYFDWDDLSTIAESVHFMLIKIGLLMRAPGAFNFWPV